MITMEDVRLRLKAEGISYIVQRDIKDEHWASHAIIIDGGSKEAPLRVVFGEADGEQRFIDLRFGQFDYEFYQNTEESVMDELVDAIRAVISGKTKVISDWYTETKRWRGDACFYVAPGEEDDGSYEYTAALQRIERPKSRLCRLLTRSVTYAIYDWFSYREITR